MCGNLPVSSSVWEVEMGQSLEQADSPEELCLQALGSTERLCSMDNVENGHDTSLKLPCAHVHMRTDITITQTQAKSGEHF